MSKVRVAGFSISVDGFGAGAEQSISEPMGKRGMDLHQWALATRTFRAMFGQSGGSTGTDEGFMARALDGFGAHVMGRNMFGPVRGPWPNESWKGWWGDTPPYHTPVFVLTHHARAPLEMAGGTVFHFVTDGIASAVAQAKAVAGDRDVKIGGGVATVRAGLQAGLIDELHFAVSPVMLGRGEAVFAGIDLPALGFRAHEQTMGEHAMHVMLRR